MESRILACVLALVVTVSGLKEKTAVLGGLEEVFEGLSRERRAASKEQVGKSSITAAEKTVLLDKHNEMRRLIGASDMLLMSWDNELQTLAQEWADGCRWGHRSNANRRISTGELMGENLWARTGTYDEEAAVISWYNEDKFYTYSSNTCETNKMCGHYTQVIWATSEKVGCGISHCTTDNNGVLSWTDFYVVVCNYFPAGNINTLWPYQQGTACSACPAGKETCDNGLCSAAPATTTTSTTTTSTTTTPSAEGEGDATTEAPETTTSTGQRVATSFYSYALASFVIPVYVTFSCH